MNIFQENAHLTTGQETPISHPPHKLLCTLLGQSKEFYFTPLYQEKDVSIPISVSFGLEHSSTTTPIKHQKDAASAQACNQHETGIKGGVLVIKQPIRRQAHVLASGL